MRQRGGICGFEGRFARSWSPAARSERGYAAIDAMVALMILALSAILSLRAVDQARRVARSAEELRRANVLLVELLDNGPRASPLSTGSTSGFDWTIETQVQGSERPIAICRRLVTLTSSTTAHRFQIATLEACPPEAA